MSNPASKKKSPLRWTLWFWLLFWIWGIIQMEGLRWKVLFAALAAANVTAYFFVGKLDVETDVGLRKVSNVLLGLMCVQIAVVAFIAFEAMRR